MHDETKADRIEWRQKFMRYLAPQLVGGDDQVREVMRTTSLTWHKAHQEGLEDAVTMVRLLAEKRQGDERELVTVVLDAIEALREKNQSDFAKLYGIPSTDGST